jgi:kynurenine formamidase
MARRSHEFSLLSALTAAALLSCSKAVDDRQVAFVPSEVIDLGALVTEDLPQRLWGKAFLKQMNFTTQNEFKVIAWKFPVGGDTISGSNAYYTLFNHGGPHVDAPNHVGAGGGIDSYAIEAFSGPVKVFDVSEYALGRSVPQSVFQGRVAAGDIVVVLTRYRPPPTDDALPEVRTLTNEAAEFLATLPVRAYGTDAFSVEALADTKMPWIHHAFLSRGIPVYEQLFNVDRLLGKERMYFVGVPLNIKGGDGMMVRPIVCVY